MKKRTQIFKPDKNKKKRRGASKNNTNKSNQHKMIDAQTINIQKSREAEKLWYKKMLKSPHYKSLTQEASTLSSKVEREVQDIVNRELKDSIERLSKLSFVRGYVDSDKTASMKIEVGKQGSRQRRKEKELDTLLNESKSANQTLMEDLPESHHNDYLECKYLAFTFFTDPQSSIERIEDRESLTSWSTTRRSTKKRE